MTLYHVGDRQVWASVTGKAMLSDGQKPVGVATDRAKLSRVKE